MNMDKMGHVIAGGVLAMAIQAGGMERVIFDTDIGGDIDDAGALAVLHALADKGEVEILAIGVTNGHPLTVPYVQEINNWYGRPDIPIGTVSKKNEPLNRDKYPSGVIKTDVNAGKQEDIPNAAMLYRRILAAQPDGSVTIVTVGPASNIARLLESTPDEISPLNGQELVRRKVKFYGAGGNGDGKLPNGQCGFNYRMDVKAAQTELAMMPLEIPMVYAGGSGRKLELGNCYKNAPKTHIIRRSYESYFKGKDSLDRPTWDQLRVLYACRPSSRKFFTTSSTGDISLDNNMCITWTEKPDRNKSYAYVKDFDSIRKQLTELMMFRKE